MWLALVISSRPGSCMDMASVQRQLAVPSGWNAIWMFMLVVGLMMGDWLLFEACRLIQSQQVPNLDLQRP
jgi:hypothetical protein